MCNMIASFGGRPYRLACHITTSVGMVMVITIAYLASGSQAEPPNTGDAAAQRTEHVHDGNTATYNLLRSAVTLSHRSATAIRFEHKSLEDGSRQLTVREVPFFESNTNAGKHSAMDVADAVGRTYIFTLAESDIDVRLPMDRDPDDVDNLVGSDLYVAASIILLPRRLGLSNRELSQGTTFEVRKDDIPGIGSLNGPRMVNMSVTKVIEDASGRKIAVLQSDVLQQAVHEVRPNRITSHIIGRFTLHYDVNAEAAIYADYATSSFDIGRDAQNPKRAVPRISQFILAEED